MATVFVFGTSAGRSMSGSMSLGSPGSGSATGTPLDVLPALGLLLHDVRAFTTSDLATTDLAAADVLLVDARRDLAQARALCRLLQTSGVGGGLMAVLTEGGLTAVTSEWGVDDVILDTAGPAEVETRIRLLLARRPAAAETTPGLTRWGDLVIDEHSYTVKLRGGSLDLTFKEFELLKFLAQHAGRVFTRAQLLQEVWGYDYFGGTRTVDVHVRRLRAKLGAEHETLIGTVRNVGYRFVSDDLDAKGDRTAGSTADSAAEGPAGTSPRSPGSLDSLDASTGESERGAHSSDAARSASRAPA